MTSPIEETPRGRSPGAILAGLLAILLLCGGVVVWDQMRGKDTAGTVSPPPATGGTSSPAPQPASPSSGGDGFGGLK